MVTLIPAILATNESEFSEQLNKLKSASALEDGWVHIDFMDGELVETKSIQPSSLATQEIPFHKEAHLMVKNPIDWIKDLKEQGFERVIIHLEAEKVMETLDLILQSEMSAGLAINPETSLEEVKKYSEKIEVLQVMAIHPGKQGQSFLLTTYDKVKDASKMVGVVAVDGSVNLETALKLIEAGAERLVIGSYLQKGDIDENLEKIWEALG